MRALFTAATGMDAQQVRIDTIANNLANVGTTGFKRYRAEFQDLFYETLRDPGTESSTGEILPTGSQVGHGVVLGSVTRIDSQGDRITTQRELDLVIDGAGYFQIELPSGELAFTRDGAFQVGADGSLMTRSGALLQPNLQLPADAQAITILEDGTVSASVPGSTTPTLVGQLELARFANPGGLRPLGANLFEATAGSGDPEVGVPNDPGFGGISQGFLEGSNVNMAEELVRLILAQRAFEVNSRVIQTADEMLQRATA
jgi:flagellar basal-body rod protein FlgG